MRHNLCLFPSKVVGHKTNNGGNNPLSFQDPTGLISYTGGSSGGGGGWGGILGFGLNIALNIISNSLMQPTPTPRPLVQGAAINLKPQLSNRGMSILQEGQSIKKSKYGYETFSISKSNTNEDAETITGLGMGFTPLGTGFDVYSAITGKDFVTNEQIGWGWRAAGIVPFVSEIRLLGKAKKLFGHHPLPVVFGGHIHGQDYVSLTSKVHNELHTNINAVLKAQYGASHYKGMKFWNRFFLTNPSEQRKVFNIILKESFKIDKKYGTDVTNAVLKAIEDGKYSTPNQIWKKRK